MKERLARWWWKIRHQWMMVRIWVRRQRAHFLRWRYYRMRQLSYRWSELWHPFWLWLYQTSGRKLYIEERVDSFEEDWFRLVRHQLRQLRESDLGQAFVELLFVDPRIVQGGEGREVRLPDRETHHDR